MRNFGRRRQEDKEEERWHEGGAVKGQQCMRRLMALHQRASSMISPIVACIAAADATTYHRCVVPLKAHRTRYSTRFILPFFIKPGRTPSFVFIFRTHGVTLHVALDLIHGAAPLYLACTLGGGSVAVCKDHHF